MSGCPLPRLQPTSHLSGKDSNWCTACLCHLNCFTIWPDYPMTSYQTTSAYLPCNYMVIHNLHMACKHWIEEVISWYHMFLICSSTHSLAHTFPLPLHHSLLPVDFSSEPIWYGFCLLVYFPPFPVCSKLCFFMWFTSPFQLCCSQFFQVMGLSFCI